MKNYLFFIGILLLLLPLSLYFSPIAALNIQQTPTAPTTAPLLITNNASTPWDIFSSNITTIKDIVTTLAIIVGFVAGYYKFYMGRVFMPRIVLTVEGKLFLYKGHHAVWSRMTIKNNGLSKVIVHSKQKNGEKEKKISWKKLSKVKLILRSISINDFRTHPEKLEDIYLWTSVDQYPVFFQHHWIESGDSITDECLFPIKDAADDFAYSLELVVETYARKWLFWSDPFTFKVSTMVSEGLPQEKSPEAKK